MIYQKNGVDHIWDVSDTFTEDDRWIKEFLKSKPKDCNIKFQIYGRPNHITLRMAKQLKELGVYEVLLALNQGMIKS